MKIKIPDGSIYDLEECEIIDEELEQQAKFADELFVQTGILIANQKGGDASIE
ncbi:hypothetical protein [Enterocloster clostridioformis]|uniref:Uncharacterized protein n=1 Tax=Enterocloster clostridioformis TaxID=1531 RepID=A0A829WFG9_9FIRM|nr:hypothetical protein [Enterocloster clostridioformis]QIX93893.1 hypothetical protein FOC47_27125 [Enterocloster clostridioformis]GEA37623.1 hypothetical protein Ccl03g_33360 [Enterocloster clostridioformis]DAY95319.1 MAG TPA: hypothetical protein [Caudoviricetes sp.]